MNERIRQLAIEAGFYANPDVEKFEKFAQLIVRECAAEADKQTIYCRGIPWGRWLKDHFGLQD